MFKGPQFEYFAITQVLLVIWLGWIALQSSEAGLSIPKACWHLEKTINHP
jgi:hypothetical protein